MIPKSYKGDDLKGRVARVERDMRNGGGQAISTGSKVTIVNVVRGAGITVKTEPCPHCGQYCYMTHVNRNELTLLN